MAWLWSDDLARLLIEEGAAEPSSLADWITSPVAFAVPEDADPRLVAADLLGVASDTQSVA